MNDIFCRLTHKSNEKLTIPLVSDSMISCLVLIKRTLEEQLVSV